MTDREKFLNEVKKVKLIIQANRAQGAFSEGYLIGQESVLEHFENLINSMQEEPKDKCKGCNNVKGCITCVDGSEWAHYSEAPEVSSEVWHDANKEQPEFGRTVAIWNPKILDGEILTRCTQVYSDRIWAYVDDLLSLTHSEVSKISDQEPISEDMEKAAKVYEQIRNDLDVVSDNQMVERAFKAGAYWQKEQLFRWKESVKLWSEKDENSFEDEFAKTLAEKKEILPQGENRFSDLDLYRVALHFSGWKQRQMMKDAIDGFVLISLHNSFATVEGDLPNFSQYKHLEEVKLIIIKENGL